MADYYLHVAELIERQGAEALNLEDIRLQEILGMRPEAQRNPEPSAEEVERAKAQRRVLDAYYEAAASHLSQEIAGFAGSMESFDLNSMDGLDINKIRRGADGDVFGAEQNLPRMKGKGKRKEKNLEL